MNLVDVHCHLNHEQFQEDLDEVLQRAKQAGLKAIIISGTNTQANQQVLEMAKKGPLIKISLGIHPIDALGLSEGDTGIPKQSCPINLEQEFQFIEQHQDQIVAIGEVGLDYHWDKTHHSQQIAIFKKIIKFALKIKKPLIIHTWEAEEECLNILESEVKHQIPILLHCFGGRKALITRAKDLGYYFSIPPSVVKGNFYPIIKKVPLTQLLTETDAPWQSPFQDTRNEPAFIVETIKKIAQLKNLTEEEVADQIWKNYQKIFSS